MLGVIAALLVTAAAAPALTRRIGRDTGYVIAGVMAIATAGIAFRAPGVLDGRALTSELVWVPGADLAVSLRMDGLSLLFTGLVLVIGVAVMAYAARYLSADGAHGRLFGWLTLFATSMFGLVVADDLIALVVFWEMTSVSSFMLIAGDGSRREPATRALVVTTGGGLALLAAAALITGATGVRTLSELLADPSLLSSSPAAPAVVLLLALAAATKSAQVPFHFWLPGAMVAPTPISTYLHAATMVKAGIYLLLRFSPVLGELAIWQGVLVPLGLATTLWGAILAVQRHDLKEILAYSTMSQLGLMVALAGLGTPDAAAAVGVLLVAHGAYKATLFMVAGIIDHETGTRDIRELSGLRRSMPGTAAVAALAAISMAGLPPLLGFVGKEEALIAAFAAGYGTLATVLVVGAIAVSSTLTVAYSARLFLRVFTRAPGAAFHDVEDPRVPEHDAPWAFLAPAVVTASIGVVIGIGTPILQAPVDALVAALFGEPLEHRLALWHGVSVELGISAVVVAAGITGWLRRQDVAAATPRFSLPQAAHGVTAYDRAYSGVLAVGGRAGSSVVPAAPTTYVAAILLTTAVAGLAFVVAFRPDAGVPIASGLPLDWLLVALVSGALVLVVAARDRMTTVLALGVVGYLLVAWFAGLGAADLAMTVLLVETLFVAAVVLAIRNLPDRLARQRPVRAAPVAGISAALGILAGAATWTLAGRGGISDTGRFFLENSEELAGGTNVVNTILVDFRALDTLGEITVVLAALVGLSLITGRVRDRRSGEDAR